MRKKIVAGNWKMNTTPAEGVELFKGVAAKKGEVCSCVNFIVAPPFTHLSEIVKAPEERASPCRPRTAQPKPRAPIPERYRPR